jgi:hypothetical protein
MCMDLHKSAIQDLLSAPQHQADISMPKRSSSSRTKSRPLSEVTREPLSRAEQEIDHGGGVKVDQESW